MRRCIVWKVHSCEMKFWNVILWKRTNCGYGAVWISVGRAYLGLSIGTNVIELVKGWAEIVASQMIIH